ncbi:LPS-assembly protein LptD [Roseiarcaceae bacterium H3SJ34-1]|uniref:LPS-assembly protein LptD n=1 Tax=Terripilifer ovatus TaxID=3032367 RepID=UPI003AB91AB0|nr:LPS-assembly protein LptD [Roseiarcaceae bacterium H3SJ34-1]
MGRRWGPEHVETRRSTSGTTVMKHVLLALCAILVVSGLAAALPAAAQTLNDKLTQRVQTQSPGGKTDRLLVDANELNYDRDKNTIGARGNVQLYYQGRILQADRVTYNRNTNRVFAEGNAKMTERDGTVSYATRFELTDDFKDGFIDSLRADTADKTHFTAARAERTAGEQTVFTNGTYTACEPCKNDATKPPFWQIRAKRIIHNNSEQMIYYEDATLELYGHPVAWLPYFSTPDPSVERKSGILAPTYVYRSYIGAGVGIPIYWAIDPTYDLTVTPTFLTKQGLLADATWRQQFVNGSYQIRGVGIFQNDPSAFYAFPYGPGSRHTRGELESKGEFFINDKWKFGWDATLLSDRWFLQHYAMPTTSLSANYFQEANSSIYFTGKGDRGYFDLRGFYFQGLGRSDIQAQQPLVGPVLDYNKTIDIKPENSGGIGGQFEIDFNFTKMSRELASYEAIGATRLDRAYGLYNVCETAAGVPIYKPGSCLLRGFGGDYARATLNLSWKRKFIDPLGQVWTPFVFAHVNATWASANLTNTTGWSNPLCGNPPCTSVITNASQSNFFGPNRESGAASVMPGVGIEYRYPFLASTSVANMVFEPIVQVITRPNENSRNQFINEDAQSLVFDDSNLFDWSKYSGYDRFEGGTRANYGAQFTANFNKGGYFNMMVGQSRQLAGVNSYNTADAANIGLSSGLDSRASDYVARATFAPNSMFNFVAKGRFDEKSFTVRRLDLMANANLGRLEASVQYARYDAQPLLGYNVRREGLAANGKFKIDDNYFATGSVIFDLSRHLYNSGNTGGVVIGSAPLFSIAGLGAGIGYSDECTTIMLNYTSIYRDNGLLTPTRNQTIMLQLQLRTVGDTSFKSSLGDVRVQDGLSSAVLR